MSVAARVEKLFDIFLSEIKQNKDLANRIAEAMGQPDATSETTPATTPAKRRRRPAVLDPFSVLSEGEQQLRGQLKSLDMDALKDIVAEFGLDPSRLVSRWKKADRVVEHIVATVVARARRGDAFRNP